MFGEPNEKLRLNDCFDSEEYKRMLDILQKYRQSYCSQCPSFGVCNGVCVCMSYMYVQDEKLLKYSCNQSNRIFESILAINDEIIEDFNNNEFEKYNDTVRRSFK